MTKWVIKTFQPRLTAAIGLVRVRARILALPVLLLFRITDFCSLSQAGELGTVKSIDPSTLPQTGPDHLNIETPASATPPPADRSDVSVHLDRPWTLDTPAGATAFVLDQKQVEFGFTFDRLSQLIHLNEFLIGARAGIFDTLTLDASIGLHLVSFGTKWNFLNVDAWSYAIRPSYGFSYGGGNSYGSSYSNSSSNSPMTLELAASRVIDDSHRLHFTLEGGKNLREEGYHSSWYSSSDFGFSDSNYRDQFIGMRIAAAYEVRLNEAHGLTYWVSPEMSTRQSDNTYNYSGSYSGVSSSQSNQKTTSIKVGVGYHYWTKHYGVSVGVALGPSWETTDYNYSGYGSSYKESTPIQGAFSGGINYRL